jgi:DNA-directed RNA polymerase sigma subunit (sigma70/sigma32)
MYENLKAIHDKQESVNQGLETLKKFERYTNDIAFVIDIDNVKTTLQKLMVKCQALITRIKQILESGSNYLG